MADLAPWGQRTTQWTDGWLVLASEQKKRTVPRQGCPRFINSLCVWYVPFLSLQLLTQWAHPASPSTNQQANNPKRHKALLQQASTYYTWDIMSISQLMRGGGLTSCVSYMGYVCHESMALRSYNTILIKQQTLTLTGAPKKVTWRQKTNHHHNKWFFN